MTFLQHAAARIYQRHQSDQRDVWVVLPTRRAVLVFLDELARQAPTDRPFLAPHAVAVDDFIMQAAGVQLIDPVRLLFELYEVFQAIDSKIDFEQFMGWANIVLADFDRIDQHLVNANELFGLMSEAKRIDAWAEQLNGQAATIPTTPGMARYFRLFENLHTAYRNLHQRLTEQGLAYRGMAYRQLAENVQPLLCNNPAYEFIWLVGFNALSAAEKSIYETLTKTQKAELIWDADPYYMQDARQEAGFFLRDYQQNKHLFSAQNREDLAHSDNLLEKERAIRVVGVANATLQAKMAGQFYRDSQPDAYTVPPKTAIVLADETLLLPMLYALDERVTDLNITMGMSLRNSLLFTLIDTLFEMQRTVHEFRSRDGRDLRIPKFHYRHIIKVLNHPFVKQYERIQALKSPGLDPLSGDALPPEPLFTWMAAHIIRYQLVYLTADELHALGGHDPLLTLLFQRWPAEHPEQAIQVFYGLIDRLREVYKVSQDSIEIEYLYLFQTLLKQLEATLEQQATTYSRTPVTLKSFRQFLYELIRQTTIPFTSEGNSRLQVMGMLETRALDFERVIILSANEGILPQTRKLNSLIPFDIAIRFRLPTYREQEAVMAYHFYRLLQRAADVVLLYTTTDDAYGVGKGEPSRFIRQLEYELVPRSGQRTTLQHPVVGFGTIAERSLLHTDWQVPKTPDLLARLHDLLTTKGLYPSSLNEYVRCSMQFYFSRMVGIAEEQDVEERMGPADFGNWLHKVLERLDTDYRMQGKDVDEAIIQQLLDDEFTKHLKGRVVESGINLLLYTMARQLMLTFQQQQQNLNGLTVLGTEQTLDTWLAVNLNDHQTPIRVRIAGKIDRLERQQDTLRIVDYKTGKVETRNVPADKLLTDPQADKVRQLWLYRYLALKSIAQNGGLPLPHTAEVYADARSLQVEAGFYSFRQLDAGFITNPVRLGAADTTDAYIAESEELLRTLIRHMLDPAQPFSKTQHIHLCAYCDFRRICGR